MSPAHRRTAWCLLVGAVVGLAYGVSFGDWGLALALGPVIGALAAAVGARRDPRR